MRFLLLVALATLVACAPEQCPPSTMEVDGFCLRHEADAGKPQGGAIVAAGGVCEKAGELRCETGSEVGRLRCVGGQWQDAPPCSESALCQRAGAAAGMCIEIVDRCAELGAGVYCTGSLMHTCEAGKEASSEACDSPELCEAGQASGFCRQCLEGEFRCRGARLERCETDGTWNLETVCEPDTSCDASMGVCGSEAAERTDAPVDGSGAEPAESTDEPVAGSRSASGNPPASNLMCAGEASQACGNCGMQTRICDPSTGQWSEWLPCSGEGECKAGVPGTCGTGGTRTCGSDCTWGTACSGQECSGALTRACGNCGRETRSCDSNTGQLGDWMGCQERADACMVGMTRACPDANEVQTCTVGCIWGPCTCRSSALTMCQGTCAWSQTDDNNCGASCADCTAQRGRFSQQAKRCEVGRCVECTSNADCSGPIGFCSSSGECVGCLRNEDCVFAGDEARCSDGRCLLP
jgi:hypothetical protein